MSGNEIVLVVDDDVSLLETTAYMVETLGYYVITAQNGMEAVEKYKEIKPSLVFMDVKMPMMDGFEAFFKIKNYDSDAKVVLITAYAMDEKKHLKAQSMNLLDTIEKPYDIERIEDALKNIFIHNFIISLAFLQYQISFCKNLLSHQGILDTIALILYRLL